MIAFDVQTISDPVDTEVGGLVFGGGGATAGCKTGAGSVVVSVTFVVVETGG
jgi:hypothetical protein